MKYLGKTTNKDPYVYRGSGKRWLNHIKTHGYDVTTEILYSSESKQEIIDLGIYYSNLWDVVASQNSSNLKIECGDVVTSLEATSENNRRLESGTHNFCDPNFNKKTKDKRNETIRKNGTHNFLGGELQRKRVENGSHHFLSGDIQRETMNRLVAEGKHPMQTGVVVVDIHGKTVRIDREEYNVNIRTVMS